MNKAQQESANTLYKQGYALYSNASIGFVFARIDSDGMLQRRVIDTGGLCRTYLPRKATKYERQRLLLSRNAKRKGRLWKQRSKKDS